MDFSTLRELMVDTQLLARGIRDERVLNAMRKVPREMFVSPELSYKAYDDMALPIGEGQTISQPYMVAIMTELLELEGSLKTLEIGTGSGYQTAILSELSGTVYTIERIAGLSGRAKAILDALAYQNVHYRIGDGTGGWPEEAPFDRMLVTAGAPDVPAPLIEQLSEGGIIVIPVGELFSQIIIKARKEKGRLREESHTPCVFVPLLGEHGWREH